MFPIIYEDHKIVTVAQVFLDPERVLHVPIELVEVDIGEDLARHVSDGNASRRFKSTLSLSLRSENHDLWCNSRSLPEAAT